MVNQTFNGFGLQAAKSDLISLIQKTLSQELSKEVLTAGGFVLECWVASDQHWNLHAVEKSLFLHVPLDFTFKKPEGLFSIEGEGGISLEIVCNVVLQPSEELFIELELKSHIWHKSPVVNMGIIDFPVEFIADCIVQNIKEKHLDRWMNSINEEWNISKRLIEAQEKFARNVVVYKKPDFYFNFELKKIVFVGFQDENTSLRLLFYADYQGQITDSISPFFPEGVRTIDLPVVELLTKSTYLLNFFCSYEGLERMILFYFNNNEIGGKTFDVDKVSIRNTSTFEVKLFLREPIEGTVTLKGVPHYNKEKSVLDIADIKVDLAASRFLHRLSSPIVQKVIRNRIEEYFPLDLHKILSELQNELTQAISQKGLTLVTKNMALPSLDFENSGVKATLTVDEFNITMNKKGWTLYSI